jgi:hypothetical protein
MQCTIHHPLHLRHLSCPYCSTNYLSFPQRVPSFLCMRIVLLWTYCHVLVDKTLNRSSLIPGIGCGSMKAHRIHHTYLIIDILNQFCKMGQSKDFNSLYIYILCMDRECAFNNSINCMYLYVDVDWWLSVWPHPAHHILSLWRSCFRKLEHMVSRIMVRCSQWTTWLR